MLDPTPRIADQHNQRLLRILADAANIGLSHQRTYRQSQRRVEQLQRALHNRVVIEQAKGIIATQRDIPPSDASEILLNHARRDHHRLAEVAEDVVQGRLSNDQLMPPPDKPPDR
jgi:AmiR/NasT family two-component response regulator